ncbi:MAG: pantoate--beta-alanine ligase [Candidatus Melainabacteria bacterium]|nr:pantoate--beta-alanine ligase [Candidatus Melainabacteria bacterium]
MTPDTTIRTMIPTAETLEAVRTHVAQWKEAGKSIALVPTMGALHEGHAALIRQAKKSADRVVVSIFVNPIQFGPQEDYQRYPRPFAQDVDYCTALGADCIFAPPTDVLYPDGNQPEQLSRVLPPERLTARWCGASRPGHFVGVATVVLKLLNIVQPHVALFGEKDAQQLAVIRQMVSDFNLPVRIEEVPTVRQPNGLALSSRNQYLNTPELQRLALWVPQLIEATRDQLSRTASIHEALENAKASVLNTHQDPQQLFQLEYLAVVEDTHWEPLETLRLPARIIVAARVGTTRLIDNQRLLASPP